RFDWIEHFVAGGDGVYTVELAAERPNEPSSPRIIRRVASDGTVRTLVPPGVPGRVDGLGSAASFTDIQSVCTDQSGNLYLLDYPDLTSAPALRRVTSEGLVTTLVPAVRLPLTAGS